MTWGDRAPYAPVEDPKSEKTMTIPAEKVAQFCHFKEAHNTTCAIPEWLAGFTPTSKFKYTVRETGMGPVFNLVCDCGEKYYADAGDEDF